MSNTEWIEKMRAHLAMASVIGSTLMKQSGKGRNEKAQKFLLNHMPLTYLNEIGAEDFDEYLNKNTDQLAKLLTRPRCGTDNWGAARKVINIYLRLCAMNRHTYSHYNLEPFEPCFEVPLDNHVVEKISEESGIKFTENFQIITLDNELNKQIQEAALEIAGRHGRFRYELDVEFWNRKKINDMLNRQVQKEVQM